MVRCCSAYTKHSEGGDYPNNTAPGVNVVLPETEAVPPVDGGLGPGGCVVYKWMVDAIAGPNAGEPAGVWQPTPPRSKS